MIRTLVQNAMQYIFLGNAHLCTSEAHVHAQNSSECMPTLGNTFLYTTQVSAPVQKAVYCLSIANTILCKTKVNVHV